MAGIKHVTVARYNYMAHLPEDFDRILSVYRSDVIYIDSLEMLTRRYGTTITGIIPNNDEHYFIQDRCGDVGLLDIAFRGSYSKWWIIRKCQQFVDIYYPVKYKITYYSK